MKDYRFLHFLGGLCALLGILGVAGGLVLCLLGFVQIGQSFGAAVGSIAEGLTAIFVSLLTFGLAVLIDLLLEIRARLAGTYVETTKPAPVTTAPQTAP